VIRDPNEGFEDLLNLAIPLFSECSPSVMFERIALLIAAATKNYSGDSRLFAQIEQWIFELSSLSKIANGDPVRIKALCTPPQRLFDDIFVRFMNEEAKNKFASIYNCEFIAARVDYAAIRMYRTINGLIIDNSRTDLIGYIIANCCTIWSGMEIISRVRREHNLTDAEITERFHCGRKEFCKQVSKLLIDH
jgi:hypothetical protein